MINAAELTTLRAAFLPTFTETATVQRRVQVRDDSGGLVDTYPVVGTYPCSFTAYPIRPFERESDVRIQSITLWLFHFAAGTVILGTDRLIVGSRTFEVTGAGEGSRALTLQVIAQEIV